MSIYSENTATEAQDLAAAALAMNGLNGDTFRESMAGIFLPHAQAVRVIKEHGTFDEIDTFYSEYGDLDEYLEMDLRDWLGYGDE